MWTASLSMRWDIRTTGLVHKKRDTAEWLFSLKSNRTMLSWGTDMDKAMKRAALFN